MATWEETRQSMTAVYDTMEMSEENRNVFENILNEYTLPESSDETKGLKEQIETLNNTVDLLRQNNTTLLRMIGTQRKDDNEPDIEEEKTKTIDDILEMEVD